MRFLVVMLLGLAVCASGCGRDIQAFADQQVHKKMLANHEKSEAIPFFEGEGHFFDLDETTSVDHDVVLPMLKGLKDVIETEQWAVLSTKDPKMAMVVLVELPQNSQIVDQMALVVEEADAKFPGLILQQWGHEWLAMNLIDQETYEFLKQSEPDIDKQRPDP